MGNDKFDAALSALAILTQGATDMHRTSADSTLRNLELQAQRDEANLGREHAKSMVLLGHELDKRNKLMTRYHETKDEAKRLGISLDKIQGLEPESQREGGDIVAQDLQSTQEENTSIVAQLNSIDQNLTQFYKGAQIAATVDKNKNFKLDDEELAKYLDDNSLDTLPDFLRRGIDTTLSSPEYQKSSKELKSYDQQYSIGEKTIEKTDLELEALRRTAESDKRLQPMREEAEKAQLKSTIATSEDAIAEAEAKKASGYYKSFYENSLKESDLRIEKLESETSDLEVFSKQLKVFTDQGLRPMTPEMSKMDFLVGGNLKDTWKNFSTAQINEYIEDYMTEGYEDAWTGGLDYSDASILPKVMRGYARDFFETSEEEWQALGLQAEDFVAEGSPKLDILLDGAVLNMMSGFNENQNYLFKNPLDLIQAKVLESQSKEAIWSEHYKTFEKIGETLTKRFYKTDSDQNIEFDEDQVEAIAAKLRQEDDTFTDEYVSNVIYALTSPADNLTKALIIQQSDDTRMILEAAGLGAYTHVIDEVSRIKSESQFKSGTFMTVDSFNKMIGSHKAAAKKKAKLDAELAKQRAEQAAMGGGDGARALKALEGQRDYEQKRYHLRSEKNKAVMNLMQYGESPIDIGGMDHTGALISRAIKQSGIKSEGMIGNDKVPFNWEGVESPEFVEQVGKEIDKIVLEISQRGETRLVDPSTWTFQPNITDAIELREKWKKFHKAWLAAYLHDNEGIK